MDENEFKNAIENNWGYNLFRFYHGILTEKQRELAFKNAIENNWGYYLIDYCPEKLTQEEIAFIKNKQ